MTNIPGSKVIIDSDAIIGLIHDSDGLHERCLSVLAFLKENDTDIFVTYAIVLEAATTLAKDKTIKRPDIAKELLCNYMALGKKLDGTNSEDITGQIYSSKTSKKNSPFDFYVLACAQKNNIKTVFSFDSFYKKNGLALVEDLL